MWYKHNGCKPKESENMKQNRDVRKLSEKAVERALQLDDLLEESARQGAAKINAMSDEEVEQYLATHDKRQQSAN